jgi:hypothetical protein
VSKRFTDAEIFINGYKNAICQVEKLSLSLRQFIVKNPEITAHDLLVKMDLELDKLKEKDDAPI